MRIKARSDKVLLRCGRKNLFVTSSYRDVTDIEMETLKDHYGDKLSRHIEIEKESETVTPESDSPDSPPEKTVEKGVSVRELSNLLKEVKDMDILEDMLEKEKNGENRKSAIKLIEDRMKKL